MADAFYDPTDPVALGELVEEQFKPKDFFRARIFNSYERNFDEKTHELQLQTGARDVAPLNDCESDPAVRERENYEARLIQMPYSRQGMPFTCNDKFKRKKGKTLFPENRNTRAEMEEQIIDDVQTLNWALDRREELMSIEVATTGKLVTPKCTIDFGMKASHLVTLTLTDLWTDPAAKILAKIRELVKIVRRDSGQGQIAIVIGEAAYTAFLAHQEIKDCLDNRRINLGSIDPMEMGGAMRVGVLTDPMAELWTYDEYYKDPQTGLVTETDMYPTDKITIFAKGARQGFGYGGIGHCAAPSRSKRYAHSWVEDKKGTHWLSMDSSPCPFLSQPNGILTATVV